MLKVSVTKFLRMINKLKFPKSSTPKRKSYSNPNYYYFKLGIIFNISCVQFKNDWTKL